MSDPKQDPVRPADHRGGSKSPRTEEQRPLLDVSGVVYEGVSAGRDSTQKNEGEGNRTAAREYNEATTRFAQSGRVAESGKRAREAVEGGEKAELERAEKVGKSKIHEEDPAVERKSRG